MWLIAKTAKKYVTKHKPKKATGTDLNIQCGRPVLIVQYGTLRIIGLLTVAITLLLLFYAIQLIISAINIRVHFGTYLNMVTNSDGDILPTCLALPAFISTVLSSISLYFTYKVFSKTKRKKLNHFMFVFIMTTLSIMVVFFIVCICVLSDVYSNHEKLHDGIVEAMHNYSKDSTVKSQIDALQIEFQCCGSKKYDEWYDIEWYDTSLIRKGEKTVEGETPFSCCSLKSPYTCIHHGIEMTGKVYLYTPETNLSISTEGCAVKIKRHKQKIGWGIVGKIMLLISLTLLQVSSLRFLQTAHFDSYKLEDDEQKNYTIWLCGCYVGTRKKKGKKQNKAPPVPPIPPELTS